SSDVCSSDLGEQGYNLLSSTLLLQDDGSPFHVQQAEQIRQYKRAYEASGFSTGGMTAVTRSMFAIRSIADERLFGQAGSTLDQAGHLDGSPARSGPTYVGPVEELAQLLSQDKSVVDADYVLFANHAQLGSVRNRVL